MGERGEGETKRKKDKGLHTSIVGSPDPTTKHQQIPYKTHNIFTLPDEDLLSLN